jgi:hypothetical protein
MGEKACARVGEFDPLAGPDEKGKAERPLHLGDADRQGGLRHMAMGGGAGEVALIDDGEEIANEIAIQRDIPPEDN